MLWRSEMPGVMERCNSPIGLCDDKDDDDDDDDDDDKVNVVM